MSRRAWRHRAPLGAALALFGLLFLLAERAPSRARAVSASLLRAASSSGGGADDGDDGGCAAGAHCYAFGSGSMQTSKNTWACADPVAAAEWLLRFLPATPWMLSCRLSHRCSFARHSSRCLA